MKHLTKIKLFKICSHQLNCNGQVSIIKLNSRDCNPKIPNPGLVYNPESEIPGLTWPNYSLSGAPLQRLDSIKDLGVIFDSKLKFNKHVDAKCGSLDLRAHCQNLSVRLHS